MSGKGYLIDTNIMIAFFNGEQIVANKINSILKVQIPCVVLGELYFGANKPAKATENIRQIQAFLPLCSVLPADAKTSYWYGNIRNILSKKGKPIPENDIWIAAIARQHQLTLVSRDKHFNEVDRLDLEVW